MKWKLMCVAAAVLLLTVTPGALRSRAQEQAPVPRDVDLTKTVVPLPAGQAAQLVARIAEQEAAVEKMLEEIDQAVVDLPTSSSDLATEAELIRRYLDLVRMLQTTARDFNQGGPEMLATCAKYRGSLQKAMKELQEGATADRARGSERFVDLASAEGIIAQAYEPRLARADELYRLFVEQLGHNEESIDLLERWEVVLLLMLPVAETGAITEEQLMAIRTYFNQVDRALSSFREFSNRLRDAASSATATKKTAPSAHKTRR